MNSTATINNYAGLGSSGVKSGLFLVEKSVRYPGLDAVLSKMKELVYKYRADSRMISIVHYIVENDPEMPKNPKTGHPDMRNFQAISDAVYRWIAKHVRYTRDPHDVERLQSPDATILQGSGDCDDMSILGATLLSSVGIPTRFRVVSDNADAPENFSHIYFEYQIGEEWRPFDVTLAEKAGVGIPENFIYGSKYVPLSGLSDTGYQVKKNVLVQDFGLGDCGCKSAKTEIRSFQDLGNPMALPALATIISEGKNIITGADLKAIRAQENATSAGREIALKQAENTQMAIFLGGGLLAAGLLIYLIKN